jgi:hypothetical protein
MIKKKVKNVKGKAAAKQSAKKSKSKAEGTKIELNPKGTWEEVAALVESHATLMTEAVIGEAEKGQIGPVKYLFEIAKIQAPPELDENKKKLEEEDCLAKTLLDRLHIPKTPVVADELEKEDGDTVTIPAGIKKEGELDVEPSAEVNAEKDGDEEKEVTFLV